MDHDCTGICPDSKWFMNLLGFLCTISVGTDTRQCIASLICSRAVEYELPIEEPLQIDLQRDVPPTFNVRFWIFHCRKKLFFFRNCLLLMKIASKRSTVSLSKCILIATLSFFVISCEKLLWNFDNWRRRNSQFYANLAKHQLSSQFTINAANDNKQRWL